MKGNKGQTVSSPARLGTLVRELEMQRDDGRGGPLPIPAAQGTLDPTNPALCYVNQG